MIMDKHRMYWFDWTEKQTEQIHSQTLWMQQHNDDIDNENDMKKQWEKLSTSPIWLDFFEGSFWIGLRILEHWKGYDQIDMQL